MDSRYFLPNADQQAILAQAYQCLENLLRATERGENSVLREWAYGFCFNDFSGKRDKTVDQSFSSSIPEQFPIGIGLSFLWINRSGGPDGVLHESAP